MDLVLICALCAMGVLFFCWCILGWLLLPGFGKHAGFLFRFSGDAPTMEQDFRTYQWMQGSGILRGELWIVDEGLSAEGKSRLARLIAQTKGARLVDGSFEIETERV